MPIRFIKRLGLASFFFLAIHAGYGQSPMDGYKYVIVPKKFDFLKKENQYRVNSQTKFLLENSGFQTLLKGGDYPADLLANPCLAAEAKVLDESNSFTTKLRIAFTNCLGQVVYTSGEGRSKEKEYEKTYTEALNGAFESVKSLNYEYNPGLAIQPGTPKVIAQVAEEEPVTDEPVPAAAVIPAPADTDVAVPAAVPAAAVVPAAAAVEPEPVKTSETPASASAASYGNENVSFFLIDQGDKLAAYVIRSDSQNYAKGEMIGTFEKSSLPNVYRVEWKDMDKDIEQTTGYFDEQGNLKIDVKRDGKIQVLTFLKE